jgi:hypothetical protein
MAHRTWRLDAPASAARSFAIQRLHAANHLSYLGLVFRRLRKIHAIGSSEHILQIVSKQIKCRKCCAIDLNSTQENYCTCIEAGRSAKPSPRNMMG